MLGIVLITVRYDIGEKFLGDKIDFTFTSFGQPHLITEILQVLEQRVQFGQIVFELE